MKEGKTLFPNKEVYQKVLGLSCIENHVLAVLISNHIPVANCYNGFALSLKELWFHMIEQHSSYADFQGVQRIQDVLKNAGCAVMECHREDTPAQALDRVNQNEYVFMQITPEYAQEVFRVRGWREDHFVLLKPGAHQVTLLNDIPASESWINKGELGIVYAGTWFHFKLQTDQLMQWVAKRPFQPINHEVKPLPNVLLTEIDVPYLRDLVGIYRVLKRRQRDYYAQYAQVTFMDAYIKQIDMLYLQIEFSFLKKETDASKINLFVQALQEYEFEIQKKLSQEVTKL